MFIIYLIPAYFMVSTFFYIFGQYYTKSFLPFLCIEIELIHPEFENLELSLANINGKNMILFNLNIDKSLVDKQSKFQKGNIIIVKGDIDDNMLHILPIIIFSLLIAWPGLSVKCKLKAAVISIPFIIAIEFIDIPFSIIYFIENNYKGIIGEDITVYSIPGRIRLFWNSFLINGGRQFLGLLVFIVSIAPFHLKNFYSVQTGITRNDPCTCGSGKKYKNCCLK